MAKSPNKQNPQLRIFFIIGVIVLTVVMFRLLDPPRDESRNVNFSTFLSDLKRDGNDLQRIKEVRVNPESGEINGVRGDDSTFRTRGPKDFDFEKFASEGVDITYTEPQEDGFWKSLIINSLPILVLIFLIFIFMRQLQVGGGKAMSFGKSKAKMLNENQSKFTFKDVAGVDEAKEELEEIVEFLKDPKKFTKLGGRIPKGVLLVGPPGTGKTILAKAIAGEAGVPFFTISGSDFVEMFVGVGASRVRDLFDQAKKHAPCIVFIDEIDAVGRHRGAGLGGGHDEREQTLNQLLVEMDGFEANEGVILIAATNRADVLDPALLRPGRFDRRVIVPKPDLKGREGILAVHSKRSPLDKNVSIKTLAQGTPGFSGADLENLVNEAALIAARRNKDKVDMLDFEHAKDKVLMGPERKSMVMNEEAKKVTAYHESGHALVALNVPGTDPVHKMSIVPRGQALGVTVLLPDEDKYTMTKDQAQGFIAYAMGGRAAEELVYQSRTSGASDDIKKATGIARRMVCSWGMSDKIGPINIGKESEEVFLGREMNQSKPYSERLAEDIDTEVKRLVTDGYERALNILTTHRVALDNLAEALLIREVLDGKEMNAIINGKNLVTEEERKNYQEAMEKVRKDLEHRPAAEEKPAVTNSSDDEEEEDSGSLNPLAQGT